MTSASRVDRLRSVVWPAACVAGLLLVAMAQVKWGVSEEGVRPSITGLGRVSVPGASPDDVAYFFDGQTRRPGLVVVVAGAVVVVAGLLGWWRSSLRRQAIAVVAVAALVSLVTGIWTLINPADRLFSERLTNALDLELPAMQPGYGLVGTVVVAVALLGIAVFWGLGARRSRARDSATPADGVIRIDESS